MLIEETLIRYSDDSEAYKEEKMSKRTEIDYRRLKNGNVEFAGYRNVMSMDDIDKEIGSSKRAHSYAMGRCYFTIPEPGMFGIRIWNRKENVLGQDFVVGRQYASSDWSFFIDFLIEAGERYSEIKGDNSVLETVII